jgi:hypothetical protein
MVSPLFGGSAGAEAPDAEALTGSLLFEQAASASAAARMVRGLMPHE